MNEITINDPLLSPM